MPVVNMDPALFDQLIVGPMSQDNLNYYQNQFQQLSNNEHNLGQQWYQRCLSMYQRFISPQAQQQLKIAQEAVGYIGHENTIRPLETLVDIQSAPEVMLRPLMAEPSVLEAYREQSIEGYGEEYIDAFSHQSPGEDHHDWRRVMDKGIKATETGWVSKNYDLEEERYPNEEVYTTHEKNLITMAWRIMRKSIRKRELDPTSRYANPM